VSRAIGAAGELDKWFEPFLGVLAARPGSNGRRCICGACLARMVRRAFSRLPPGVAFPARPVASLPDQPGLGRGAIVAGAGGAGEPVRGRAAAVLVIDDKALPKQGTASVGVARQYCGALGKRANCQSLVSLTLARGEVPVPVGLRLFLPAELTTTASAVCGPVFLRRPVRHAASQKLPSPRSTG
jgi:hypothetical protein